MSVSTVDVQGGVLPHDTPSAVQGEGIPTPSLGSLSPQAQQTWATPETSDAGLIDPSVTSTTDSVGQAVVEAARKYLGVKYVWGGTSATGVDCSGLVQLAYKAAGVNLPRVSYAQARQGTVVGLDGLRAGDIVAWDNNPNLPGADHVAIYIGNGQIIEAARPGTNVRIRTLGSDEGAFGVRIGG